MDNQTSRDLKVRKNEAQKLQRVDSPDFNSFLPTSMMNQYTAKTDKIRRTRQDKKKEEIQQNAKKRQDTLISVL